MIDSNRTEAPGVSFGFPIRIPGFVVTCAVADPWTGGFCVGSEDGRLAITDLDGELTYKASNLLHFDEAINGIAFSGNHVAVSSRRAIEILRFASPFWDQPLTGGTLIDQGAHGVVALSADRFAAPIGVGGLLILEANDNGVIRQTSKITNKTANYIKAIRIGMPTSSDFLVCAAREFGLLINNDILDTRRSISACRPSDLDVIDVCSIGRPGHPLAVAGLGIDGTLLLLSDVSTRIRPITLQHNIIQGTAYSIASGQGHLFMLTSDGVYVFANLIDHFLRGDSLTEPMPMHYLPLQAADISVAHNRWLLIELIDEVLCLPIEQYNFNQSIERQSQRWGKAITDSRIEYSTPTAIDLSCDPADFEITMTS